MMIVQICIQLEAGCGDLSVQINIFPVLLPGQILCFQSLHLLDDVPVLRPHLQALRRHLFEGGEGKMAVEANVKAQDLHRRFF